MIQFFKKLNQLIDDVNAIAIEFKNHHNGVEAQLSVLIDELRDLKEKQYGKKT